MLNFIYLVVIQWLYDVAVETIIPEFLDTYQCYCFKMKFYI